ncbi:MAG: hypothetical protein IPM88_18330 [Nitrospira sp.]|nr:hypothetical protein [Nitrospira sp.]
MFETQVKEFVHSARKVGAEPVLCTFATSHTKKNLPDVPGEVTDFLFRYNVYLSLSGWFETITRFNQTLKRVADEEHIRLVDLDLVVSGHPEYFRDFVHFPLKGTRRWQKPSMRGFRPSSSKVRQRNIERALENLVNFNSVEFSAFFVCVLVLYTVVFYRERWRDVLLLAASYFFYMSWNWKYAGLLAFSTIVDYSVGLVRHGNNGLERGRTS